MGRRGIRTTLKLLWAVPPWTNGIDNWAGGHPGIAVARLECTTAMPAGQYEVPFMTNTSFVHPMMGDPQLEEFLKSVVTGGVGECEGMGPSNSTEAAISSSKAV
jgi:hypothetical protein